MNEAYKRYDIVLGAVLIMLATLPVFLIATGH